MAEQIAVLHTNAKKLHHPHDVKKVDQKKTDKKTKSSKSETYNQVLNQELGQISSLCKEIGSTDGKGGAQKSDNNIKASGSDPLKRWRHHVIHDLPVMMAIYLLLMSGKGSYGYLAKIMANLGVSMADIKKFITAMKKLQDDINDFMKSKDKGDWASDAADIAKQEAALKGLLKQFGGKLGPDLVKSLGAFANTNLDKVVSDATAGMDPPCTTWADAASRPEALQKLHDFMTGPKGGSTPASVTTLIKNLSDLMNSLNTQNQGDIEKLNLATKKVDSLTKLFSASITMYKGLIQTLSNYSGS